MSTLGSVIRLSSLSAFVAGAAIQKTNIMDRHGQTLARPRDDADMDRHGQTLARPRDDADMDRHGQTLARPRDDADMDRHGQTLVRPRGDADMDDRTKNERFFIDTANWDKIFI